VTRTARRRLALAALPVLFVAHNDFWLWNDPRVIGGLPVGLTWHVAYCLATAGVMAWLVRDAWPAHLEVGAEGFAAPAAAAPRLEGRRPGRRDEPA
jgi:hypothetical protein